MTLLEPTAMFPALWSTLINDALTVLQQLIRYQQPTTSDLFVGVLNSDLEPVSL